MTGFGILLTSCVTSSKYPESARQFMEENCSSDDRKCACAQREIQENIPYEDYRRFMFESDSLSALERKRINDELINTVQKTCGASYGVMPAATR